MIRRPPRSTLFPYTPALPISVVRADQVAQRRDTDRIVPAQLHRVELTVPAPTEHVVSAWEHPFFRHHRIDRKSTRLNSSHGYISYAVFCLKKKKQDYTPSQQH